MYKHFEHLLDNDKIIMTITDKATGTDITNGGVELSINTFKADTSPVLSMLDKSNASQVKVTLEDDKIITTYRLAYNYKRN